MLFATLLCLFLLPNVSFFCITVCFSCLTGVSVCEQYTVPEFHSYFQVGLLRSQKYSCPILFCDAAHNNLASRLLELELCLDFDAFEAIMLLKFSLSFVDAQVAIFSAFFAKNFKCFCQFLTETLISKVGHKRPCECCSNKNNNSCMNVWHTIHVRAILYNMQVLFLK